MRYIKYVYINFTMLNINNNLLKNLTLMMYIIDEISKCSTQEKSTILSSPVITFNLKKSHF